MKKLFSLLLATIIAANLNAQLDYESIERKTSESDLAVIGKVIDKESFWNSERTIMFTSKQNKGSWRNQRTFN